MEVDVVVLIGLLAAGCIPMHTRDMDSVSDDVVEEIEHSEVVPELKVFTRLTSHGSEILGTSLLTQDCKTWTESTFDRTVTTTRTLVQPSPQNFAKLPLIGGLGIAGGLALGGFAVANPSQTDLTSDERTTAAVLGGVGVAGGAYLLANWFRGKSMQKDIVEHVGLHTEQSVPILRRCSEEPVPAGQSLELVDGTVVGAVEESGSWHVDLADVGDEHLTPENFIGMVTVSPTGALPLDPLPEDIRWAVRVERERRADEAAEVARLAEAQARLAATQARLDALPRRLRSYQGPWKVESSTSKVDDTVTVAVSRRARTSIHGWPRATVRPSLYFRCKEGEFDAYVVTGMQAEVEMHGMSTEYASVVLRLDQDEAVSTLMTKANSGDALFFGRPVDQAREFAAHRSLLFRFVPFQSPPTETTFDLTGLAGAVDLAFAACGVPE